MKETTAELTQLNEQLHQEIAERRRVEAALRESQRSLSTLLSNLPGMAYRCRNDRDWSMEFVSEGCFALTGYPPAALIDNRNVAYGQLIHPDDRASVWAEVQAALAEKKPFQVTYRLTTATGQEKWVWEQGRGVFSAESDLLTLEGFITDITERTLAHRELEGRVQARTRELQTLLEVTATATRSLDLDEMLRTTLDRLVALVGASRAGVVLLNEDTGVLELHTLRPERMVTPESLAELIAACHQVMTSGEPLYVPPDTELGHFEPGALVPLRVRGQALGVLGIIGPESGGFSQGQLALFESMADQISVAVDNARLYQQAQQFAIVEERQRLARELHDAVTQTLFTASLIAEVLPETWELDPNEGRQLVRELRQLSRGALAEMRTLLLELRPAVLTQTSLVDLLHQLGEVVTGRTGIPVTVTEESQCRFPAEVHIAFYRIAQEALNNVAKHARAGQATLHLGCGPTVSGTAEQRQNEAMMLRISDDGCGFDLSAVSPDHMGVGIMRERAEEIGASLDIHSTPGTGTEVTVRWETKEPRSEMKDDGVNAVR